MSQLYAQLASRPDPWLIGRTSAGLCTLRTACPLTITYSGSTPAADTIAAGSAATVYGGSATSFDASADVWVALTVPGSGALQVAKEADLATLVGDWAGLARVVQHAVEPYQPQAYLGAGGLGAVVPVTTTVPSGPSARAISLWNSGTAGNDAPPSGWSTSAFDDSAWPAAVTTADDPLGEYIAGCAMVWAGGGIFTYPDRHDDAALLRHHVVLPAGAITAATLQVAADDLLLGLFVNGTAVGTVPFSFLPTPGSVVQTYDVRAVLTPGADNVLALWVQNHGGPTDIGGNVNYKLRVQTAGVGGVPDPGGHAGDLLSFHDGAWVDLPIGTTGQELTVVAGDPAWATPPAGYTDPLTTKGDLLGRSASATVRIGVGSTGQVLTADSAQADGLAWATPASSGVTSVALAGPTGTTVSGSPVTSSGTLGLSWASQSANAVLAAPDGSSGAPTFRVLASGDIPSLAASKITSGQLAAARGGTGLDTSSVTDGQVLIGQSSDHTFGLATLTAGSGVTMTNAGHSITIAASGGSGTVTSVTLTVPGFLSVSGSPITTSGTLAVTLATQSAGTVFAGPASGSAAAPTFRALAASDLPPAASAGGHIHAHGHFL